MDSTKETELLKHLMDRLETCEYSLKFMCKEKSENYRKLLRTEYNDLPTLINDHDPLRTWAEERIKNKDNWETPQCHIEFLSDCEMSYDEYRALGINDGELQSIAGVYNCLGMEAEAQRALAAVYAE